VFGRGGAGGYHSADGGGGLDAWWRLQADASNGWFHGSVTGAEGGGRIRISKG
jgi:hypothetical protein